MFPRSALAVLIVALLPTLSAAGGPVVRLLPGTPIPVWSGTRGAVQAQAGIRSNVGPFPGLAGRAPLHAVPVAPLAGRRPLFLDAPARAGDPCNPRSASGTATARRWRAEHCVNDRDEDDHHHHVGRRGRDRRVD